MTKKKLSLEEQLIFGGPDVVKKKKDCPACSGTGVQEVGDMTLPCDHPDCHFGKIIYYVPK